MYIHNLSLSLFLSFSLYILYYIYIYIHFTEMAERVEYGNRASCGTTLCQHVSRQAIPGADFLQGPRNAGNLHQATPWIAYISISLSLSLSIYIYIYTHTYTHVYIYIYIYIYSFVRDDATGVCEANTPFARAAAPAKQQLKLLSSP